MLPNVALSKQRTIEKERLNIGDGPPYYCAWNRWKSILRFHRYRISSQQLVANADKSVRTFNLSDDFDY